ncbi:hypothetical protein NDU88_004723 [Pleurodeles waltl]|uniref:Uncharacterized protein n=1 Tax=Pleurodeles waltl TaxID=8319 RepID=A0AAV7W5S6_PLEWA|nr:hypothetical protein NDU88_004723 [Pleurodeles waltl]
MIRLLSPIRQEACRSNTVDGQEEQELDSGSGVGSGECVTGARLGRRKVGPDWHRQFGLGLPPLVYGRLQQEGERRATVSGPFPGPRTIPVPLPVGPHSKEASDGFSGAGQDTQLDLRC